MNNQQKFPTLRGTDKKGKTKEWDISVENMGEYSLIITSYGYLGGKRVESKAQVNTGKNIGKRNETTHYQQALHDAESKWKRKRDTDGYITDTVSFNTNPTDDGTNATTNNTTNATSNNTTNANTNNTIVLPMLAQEFKKQAKKIVYPCYVQPKLDGYRMVFDIKTKKCTSRTGKEYTILYGTQLYQDLLSLSINMEHQNSSDHYQSICLDGELYVHDAEFAFEHYGILRKQKELTTSEKEHLGKIQYHVYDIYNSNTPLQTFEQRLFNLHTISKHFSNRIKTVRTIKCDRQQDVEQQHQLFVGDSYEGSMIRNAVGIYKPKFRSADLLKHKDFDDSEFTIVDFTREIDTTGGNQDLVVWVCQTEQGARFKVPSKGTREERQELYKKADQFIGKKLWVQYFGLTADNIPRFPKTKASGISSIRTEML